VKVRMYLCYPKTNISFAIDNKLFIDLAGLQDGCMVIRLQHQGVPRLSATEAMGSDRSCDMVYGD
jgi:hypothetical protein